MDGNIPSTSQPRANHQRPSDTDEDTALVLRVVRQKRELVDENRRLQQQLTTARAEAARSADLQRQNAAYQQRIADLEADLKLKNKKLRKVRKEAQRYARNVENFLDEHSDDDTIRDPADDDQGNQSG